MQRFNVLFWNLHDSFRIFIPTCGSILMVIARNVDTFSFFLLFPRFICCVTVALTPIVNLSHTKIIPNFKHIISNLRYEFDFNRIKFTVLQAIFGFPLLPCCATCALAQSLHQNFSKFISQVYNNIIKVRYSFGVTRSNDRHKNAIYATQITREKKKERKCMKYFADWHRNFAIRHFWLFLWPCRGLTWH